MTKSIGAILRQDRYADKDPFTITGNIPPDEEFPEGQVLRWVSPSYRARRGLRGHVLMEWDDPYIKGANKKETLKKLRKFVLDPPDKFGNTDSNYIERGDVILARIDKRIFDSRQLQRQLSSDRRLQAAARSEDNTGLFGDGLTDDKPTRKQIARK